MLFACYDNWIFQTLAFRLPHDKMRALMTKMKKMKREIRKETWILVLPLEEMIMLMMMMIIFCKCRFYS